MSFIKINHLEKDIIKKIFVFKGKLDVDSNYRLPDGNNIFTEDELNNIQTNGTEVILINEYIHLDDSISTLKKKIIKYTELRISIQELYLFSIKQSILNPSVIFNQLTQDESIPLTKERLCEFMLNIVPNSCSGINEPKECSFLNTNLNEISFDDFISFDEFTWSDIISLTQPIGQKIVMKKKYIYTVNPYNTVVISDILKQKAPELISTQNSNLLFEYGPICGNNIFICTAEEVINHFNGDASISTTNILSIYFPQLYLSKNIQSKEALLERKIALYDETDALLNEGFQNYNERVDLFYDIFYKRISNLPYENNTPGILKLEFTLHPTYKIRFPLEVIFKLINSDKNIPLIKYNPGNRKENIYRLFTNNQVATNGKSIPYLFTTNNNKKGKIIKISKILAKRKQVGFYIEYRVNENLYIITCEFELNGNINIGFNHNKAVDPVLIEGVIKNAVNETILKKIKIFLEQSGYTFNLFTSFNEPNIEFNNISFISQLKLKKNIKLKNYIGCLSSLFTVLNSSIKGRDDEIKMKYIRVSNYNEMDSIESFITERRKNGDEPDEVISLLTSNFNLSIDAAKQKFAKWASEVNVETGLFENRRITIRTNTGFPITLKQDKSNFVTSIKVMNINDIAYLKHINIYIDSFIRILLDKSSTEVPVDIINSLCKNKAELEIPEAVDDVNEAQTDIKFVDETKQQNFMNLFGSTGIDEGEQEDDEIDFGDIEFGELEAEELDGTEGSKKAVEKIDQEDEEFDFGDVDFGELTIGEIPSSSELESTPISKKQESIPSETKNISPALSSGSSDKSSDIEVDLTGLRIEGNNNIFMKRREELQPSLFLKKKSGRFKAYSRACPSEYAKQPLILTSDEKKYIDQKDEEFGTKSYDEHITYGTGDEKFHYICPRFWCLSDDAGKSRSISLEEINSGKCGGWDALIPEGTDKIPEGGRIVQFTDKRFHKKGVKTNNLLVYKPFYPSFMGKDKHPDGLCIPCCFGKPTTIGEGDWIIEKDSKGKVYYRNTKTNEYSRKPPQIEIK